MKDTIEFIKALHVYQDLKKRRNGGGKRPIVVKMPFK